MVELSETKDFKSVLASPFNLSGRIHFVMDFKSLNLVLLNLFLHWITWNLCSMVLSWSCVLIPFFAVLLWDIKTQAWWLRTMRRTSIAFSPTCAKAMGSSLVSFHSSKNDSRSSTWNRLATFYCIIKTIYVHWWIINCWPIRIRGLHHYYEKVTVFCITVGLILFLFSG